MMMFVLVCAVAMLISPCAANPVHHHNLNHIIDLAEQYNKTLHEVYFVEDVTHLADAGCGDKFICKVHDILETHTTNEKRQKEKDIMRNLEEFINATNVNCEEVLMTMPEMKTQRPLLDLLENLKKCIQKINFNGTNKNLPE